MGMCSTDDIMSLQHRGEVSTGDTESGTVKARNVPKINKHGLWWKKRNGLRKTSYERLCPKFYSKFLILLKFWSMFYCLK